jgi:hypothetical protein
MGNCCKIFLQMRNIGFYFCVMLIGVSCNSDKKIKYPDLEFFNLKGKVKTFAEIKVVFDVSSSGRFENYAKNDVNYHQLYFNSEGHLIKIENINPSPYAQSGIAISISRTEDTLGIKQTSMKETYTKVYSKHQDTLSVEIFNKIDDNNFDYHIERYKKNKYVKVSDFYLMNGYAEGTNRLDAYQFHHYLVIRNHSGLDSMVYLVERNYEKDTSLIYEVKYDQLDLHKNWLKRTFIHRDKNTSSSFPSYSEYRKIEYYD